MSSPSRRIMLKEPAESRRVKPLKPQEVDKMAGITGIVFFEKKQVRSGLRAKTHKRAA